MPGILGYGAYVPCFRIKAETIAWHWGGDPEAVKRGLLLEEKTVPGLDEDTITISVQAARYALQRADKARGFKREQIEEDLKAFLNKRMPDWKGQ